MVGGNEILALRLVFFHTRNNFTDHFVKSRNPQSMYIFVKNKRSTESYLRKPKVTPFSSMPCQDRTPFFRRLNDLPVQNWANLSPIGGGGEKVVTSMLASDRSMK